MDAQSMAKLAGCILTGCMAVACCQGCAGVESSAHTECFSPDGGLLITYWHEHSASERFHVLQWHATGISERPLVAKIPQPSNWRPASDDPKDLLAHSVGFVKDPRYLLLHCPERVWQVDLVTGQYQPAGARMIQDRVCVIPLEPRTRRDAPRKEP